MSKSETVLRQNVRAVREEQERSALEALGSSRPGSTTMRLLSVASALEIQHHPLRSLIGLFMRVLDRERLERVKDANEEAYGHLLNVYSSTFDESTENECRRRLHAFADAVGTPDKFFDLLDAGQLQLAHVVACHVVGDRRQPLDPTLHYASCGLSYASDYASQPPGEPPVGELAVVPHDQPSLKEQERRLRKWEADIEAAVAEKEETRRLELAHAEREISLLDRPGWSRTPAQQAALERMRGRRAELLAPPKEAPPRPTPDLRDTMPEWTEDLRKLAETNPVDAAEVVLTWERRVAALGGGKGLDPTIIGRGVHAREEYRRLLAGIPDRRRLLENTVEAAAAVSTELDRLSPCLAVADRLFPGAVGRELLGDIEGLYGELLGRLREACSRAREEDPAKPERASYPSTAPEGTPPRGVRYLSEDERQFLVRTSRPGATYWRDSELLTRMRDAGLVKRADDAGEDESRWQTTAAGATAVETWRYQVPAG